MVDVCSPKLLVLFHCAQTMEGWAYNKQGGAQKTILFKVVFCKKIHDQQRVILHEQVIL